MVRRDAVDIAWVSPIATLRHLSGPAVLVAIIILSAICAVWFFGGPPSYPKIDVLQLVSSATKKSLKDLLDHELTNYRETLSRLDANITLQAIAIGVTILLIIRPSNSLKIFENSIPLSWLHGFVAIFLIYLWLGFGFILHDLIWDRIRGVEIIKTLHDPTMEYQKALFRDASFIDGWFLTFVNQAGGEDYAGINSTVTTPILLALVLGTLVSISHASLLAIVSIGGRRYLRTTSNRWLYLYYLLPIVPLTLLLLSHRQFAYGGGNRNWLQLYVAFLTVPLMTFLLWLSVWFDRKSDLESVEGLRRHRQRVYPRSLNLLIQRPITSDSAKMRTISLIGDSLSTAFSVGPLPVMVFRMWRRWQPNWFLTLVKHSDVNPTVLARIGAFGPIRGIQHASVSARVDAGKPRDFLARLTDRWNFSHQVDEVLSGQFPDMLLIWIGHNNVDWRSEVSTCTRESLIGLSDTFSYQYEHQLRRLLIGALASSKRSVIIVFGLINFRSFFLARAEAEKEKVQDGKLFPYLKSDYKYFISLKPEFRDGMIQLADLINRNLSTLCERIAKELSATNVRVVYSDAMASVDVGKSNFLSSNDAWHPSTHGHKVLAGAAYSAVHDHAQFLDGYAGT